MESRLKVELIRYTPEPEKLVAAAAKLCYSKSSVDEIEDQLTEEGTHKFINMLMELGHGSPMEHISFTFGIEGVSRVLTHQLVRHRIASYSQQSQRYVKLEQFEYIIPEAIATNPQAKAIYIETMENDQKKYQELVEILMQGYAETFLKSKEVSGQENPIDYLKEHYKKTYSTFEKKAIEDARYVFPNACETKIVVTMNARALFNFFEHRCCQRAQWEIRALADEMLRCVKGVAPNIFRKAGPNCVKGPCPEGAMSCGKMLEMRQKYAEL